MSVKAMEKMELVIELGVEEIPASMLADATRQFAALVADALAAQRLAAGGCTAWFTPRRIIVGFADVPSRQENLRETVMGPPKKVAYDAAGAPTKAALAFAEKNGVAPERLRSKVKVVQTPKGEYLSLVRTVRGEKTAKLLQSLIPAAIGKIQFPKTMHWSPDDFRFIRPLRWVVALFGGKPVKFAVADVTASRFTAGHRFLGEPKIAVSSLADLKERLRGNSVLVDPAERLEIIRTGLLAEAGACGGKLLEDPALLETVVNLNEAPSVVRGSFEERFLALPKEILVTVMREHQKYFSVTGADGELLPAFLAVVNLHADKDGLIRAGHERVLRARLADAAFFRETDAKVRLQDREGAMAGVLFQEKLGSYKDKSGRVLALLPGILEAVGAPELLEDLSTAARLYKCDLVTEMVKEFTDLQGVVGGLYAKAEGYPEAVWKAIYEQYLPKSATSPSPESRTGAILALADRLDTVAGCFSVGLVPSGSGDPFALRRQGNGILKIILDHRLSLSIENLVDKSLQAHGKASAETAGELKQFFEGRLRFLFEEMGFAYDCVNATLAAGHDNPLDTLERLRALEAMRQEPDFLSLASNFKRVANILGQAGAPGAEVDEARLSDAAEVALYRSYLKVRPEVGAAGARRDYGTALRLLASMRGAVDEFFTQVMVMAEDPLVKANRVALLHGISRLFEGLADISKIVIEKK
ncbi:MAG: glycine--tRNA ligase subunit beta [Acidobacteriota bacterium]|jgi:glycyl-tRNA synthetase beta chain|nr:glycine--tRNA ligase subunit beta [Acidobacteriota bacterium]